MKSDSGGMPMWNGSQVRKNPLAWQVNLLLITGGRVQVKVRLSLNQSVYAAASSASIVDFSGQPWERAWSLHAPVSSRPPGF